MVVNYAGKLVLFALALWFLVASIGFEMYVLKPDEYGELFEELAIRATWIILLWAGMANIVVWLVEKMKEGTDDKNHEATEE